MTVSANVCVYPVGTALGGPIAGSNTGSVVEVLLVVVLGRRIAAALLGHDVDDDRAFGGQLDGVAQRRFERRQVVPVDRADVADPERLEERRRLEELAGRRLHRLDSALGRVADERNVADELLELALAPHVDRVQADVGEEVREDVADAADDRRRLRAVRRSVRSAVRLEIVGA